MPLEIVQLDDPVHSRLVDRDEAVASLIPLDVQTRLLLRYRRVPDEHSHLVRLPSVRDREHYIDLGRAEADQDVVLVFFRNAGVPEVL